MSSAAFRDALAKLINQEYANSTLQNRIGTVIQVNPDGTAIVLVDGFGVTAAMFHPVVMGQQAIVIPDGQGNFKTAPIAPNPPDPDFTPGPLFTGGIVRFVGIGVVSGTTVLRIQQAFNSNLYQLDTSDLPGFIPFQANFSPDATVLGVVLVNSTTQRARIRSYSIGASLTSSGTIDPVNKIFTLKTTLLLEIDRPAQFPTSNFSPANNPPYTIPGEVFLSNDPVMYWSEFETIAAAITDGDIRTKTHLYRTDSGGLATELGNPLTTSFRYLSTLVNVNMRSFFNVGLNSLQPLQGINNIYLQWMSGGGIWNPTLLEWLATIEDPQNSFGNLAGQINTTFVAQSDPNNQTEGPAAAAIVVGSGASFAFGGWGSSLSAGAVPSGGINISSRSSGDFFPYFNNPGSQQSGFLGLVSLTKKFRGALYRNMASTTTPNDFLNFMFEDSNGNITVDSKFTNSIAADPLLAFPRLLLPNTKTSGFVLDNALHLRRYGSSPTPGLSTIDPVSSALPISPGQSNPTVLRFNTSIIRAVSA